MSAANAQQPLRVFISYSHKDADLREELDKHLSLLRYDGYIDAWHDGKILPGEEWDKVISDNLEGADLILLLVSSDFNGSGYIREKEITRALERREGGTIVVPIVLRPCDWREGPLGEIEALPKKGEPVTSEHWHTPDDAFKDIAAGLRALIKHLRRGPTVISPRQRQPFEFPIQVYVGYAEEDRDAFERFRDHLRSVESEGFLEVWDKSQILPGSASSAEVKRRVDSADVILLLLSASFLSSGDCCQTLMPQVLARHASGGALVVPVLIRPCLWPTTDLAALDVLPVDHNPVMSSPEPDAKFSEIARELLERIDDKLTGAQDQFQGA
jgi:hypothetical protein